MLEDRFLVGADRSAVVWLVLAITPSACRCAGSTTRGASRCGRPGDHEPAHRRHHRHADRSLLLWRAAIGRRGARGAAHMRAWAFGRRCEDITWIKSGASPNSDGRGALHWPRIARHGDGASTASSASRARCARGYDGHQIHANVDADVMVLEAAAVRRVRRQADSSTPSSSTLQQLRRRLRALAAPYCNAAPRLAALGRHLDRLHHARAWHAPLRSCPTESFNAEGEAPRCWARASRRHDAADRVAAPRRRSCARSLRTVMLWRRRATWLSRRCVWRVRLHELAAGNMPCSKVATAAHATLAPPPPRSKSPASPAAK